jgi:hypothetical protein
VTEDNTKRDEVAGESGADQPGVKTRKEFEFHSYNNRSCWMFADS